MMVISDTFWYSKKDGYQQAINPILAVPNLGSLDHVDEMQQVPEIAGIQRMVSYLPDMSCSKYAKL